MQLANTGVKRFDFFTLRDFASSDETEEVATPEPVIEEEAPPPPPPPPTFSEEELEAACAKAREEGYARGVEDGTLKAQKADGERETQLMSIVKTCCEQVTQFRNEYEAHVAAQEEALTRLAVAVARHVAGDALQSSPEVPISHMVAECLPMLLEEPRIVITVHPSIITLMKDKLEQIGKQAGYDGTLLLEADESMNVTDCHIQWQGGSAHTSYEDTWKNIEEKLTHIPTTVTDEPGGDTEPQNQGDA